MPLFAALEVVDFGENILNESFKKESSIPILAAYPQSDETIDTKSVHDFFENSNLQNVKYSIFDRKMNIPHQITYHLEKKRYENDGTSLFESILKHIKLD